MTAEASYRQLEPRQSRSLLVGLGGIALGAALGAGLMFLLDPVNGHRRRGALRRLVERGGGDADGGNQVAGGVVERSRHLAAAVRARLQRHRADGRTLEARVRARLGRVASNPSAIAVIAEGSRVTLRGAVPPDELDDVLDEVASVDGVGEVYNLLQVQLAAPYVPGQH